MPASVLHQLGTPALVTKLLFYHEPLALQVNVGVKTGNQV